ncbi:OPT oligopeptide transporter [Mycena vulgaris]|nr:OPT oligopeptide transporter [Mycena vulgaris]
MFLAIIAFILGKAMESVLPSRGHPFNKKGNAFIVIMAGAAANSALATEVLVVQRLYYEITPNPAASIFLLFSSQRAGCGIGGLFRPVLLYPSKMLYPGVLPLISMFDALLDVHKDAAGATKKLRLFWIAFAVIFVWEILPEWMFPLLTEFSIFCLANPRSADFTRIFGGSNGNEGLVVLSLCFDCQYISGDPPGINPMTIPLKAQFSNFVGYILCMATVNNPTIWNAKDFPFLSQTLFYANRSQYDQLLILNDNFEIDPTLLAEQGLPFYASTWVVQLLTTNLGMAATFTHLLLWNRSDLRGAWSWATPSALKQSWATFNWKFWQDDSMRQAPKDDVDLDPHYREMLKTLRTAGGKSQNPISTMITHGRTDRYLATLILSIIVSLVIIYKTDSTLPWWGLFSSLILATISIVFFGSLYAITGLQFIIQPFAQMIGAFIHPGKPVANMFFVLFSYNSVTQAQLLLKDLKIAQYASTAQIAGTLFVLMNLIIYNQHAILLSVEGTNIWSGQQPQQYNSQAVAWGGLSHQLFAVNQRYQWVAWVYVVGLFVPIPFWVFHVSMRDLYFRGSMAHIPISYYRLCVGINSSIFSYFSITYLSQWLTKYNYILAPALDGGTQVMVFILSFAVHGASGDSHLFPQWWGANQAGNYDRCAVIPTD